MRTPRPYILSLAIALAMLLCTSCRQELCYDHFPSMALNFDWELEWERDYGMNHSATWDADFHRLAYDDLRPSVPEWVKMVKYYNDGRVIERFFTPEGATFQTEEGEECSVLFYNGDTEYIILSDVASLHEVRATATGRSRAVCSSMQTMYEQFQSNRTTNPPDVIYSSFVERVTSGTSHEVKELPIKMQPLVYTYMVTYEFEHGIEYVALARGALGGMADGVYLRTGVTTDETSIILFDCNIHSDACRSQVRSFGIPGFPDSYFGRAVPGSPGPFSLTLEVMLKNGKTVDFYFDITDQVRNQPRGGVIHVSDLRIEDEQATPPPSGFIVDVSEWNDNVEEVDLPINSAVTQ